MYRAIPFYRPPVRAVAVPKTAFLGRGKPTRGSRIRMGNADDPTAGLGVDWGAIGTALQKGAETVTQAATTLAPAYMQYRTFKENIARSREGLAPLETESIAPAMRVQVDPGRETLLTAGGLGVGLLALGGLALVLLLRRR